MKRSFSVALLAVVSTWLMAPVADAGVDVKTQVSCPAQASVGSTITVDFNLQNFECSAVNVRLISSIAGNAGGSLSGFGVFGPVVVEPSVVVPGSLDCPVSSTETVDLSIPAPPAVPASMVGTVATYIFLSEWNDRSQTEVDQCLVEVIP